MIMLLLDNFWLILFIALGLPLLTYRSKFRKIVYQTDSWVINIKPLLTDELRGLIGSHSVDHPKYKKFRNYYRTFLVLFLITLVFYFDFRGFTDTTETKVEKTKIGVGSRVPSFSLKDQNGNTFVLDSVIGKHNLVIFFYLGDGGPGCLREVWAFQENLDAFKEVDAMVIGISSQSVESHKEFATENALLYTLLSDEGNKVRKIFRVPSNLLGYLPGRVTYIVDKTGKVVYVHSSQIRTYKHATNALRFLKEMK
ncbi:MAG: alkyl hydroperoxide reductase/Thiol specific antioxidant/Mal allergen [Bacteroidetes bacterium]|nr:alkyl hydroperoxide reductase/Thiol specific antioxidant/Mal allergen [Bacteroidota bacterium]